MKTGQWSLGTVARVWAIGVVVFASWGIVLVAVMGWLERTWPGDGRQAIPEAQLRPDRAHFRPVDDPLPPVAQTGTTYVPVYSTVYLGEREVQAGMAVTLSIRNTSPDSELLVHRVEYYDTGGRLASRLAEGAHAVPAMGTAEFFIDRRDPAGGPGANYLVAWSVLEGGSEPVIEAVMIGRFSNIGISFVSRGVPIARPTAPTSAPGR